MPTSCCRAAPPLGRLPIRTRPRILPYTIPRLRSLTFTSSLRAKFADLDAALPLLRLVAPSLQHLGCHDCIVFADLHTSASPAASQRQQQQHEQLLATDTPGPAPAPPPPLLQNLTHLSLTDACVELGLEAILSAAGPRLSSVFIRKPASILTLGGDPVRSLELDEALALLRLRRASLRELTLTVEGQALAVMRATRLAQLLPSFGALETLGLHVAWLDIDGLWGGKPEEALSGVLPDTGRLKQVRLYGERVGVEAAVKGLFGAVTQEGRFGGLRRIGLDEQARWPYGLTR